MDVNERSSLAPFGRRNITFGTLIFPSPSTRQLVHFSAGCDQRHPIRICTKCQYCDAAIRAVLLPLPPIRQINFHVHEGLLYPLYRNIVISKLVIVKSIRIRIIFFRDYKFIIKYYNWRDIFFGGKCRRFNPSMDRNCCINGTLFIPSCFLTVRIN